MCNFSCLFLSNYLPCHHCTLQVFFLFSASVKLILELSSVSLVQHFFLFFVIFIFWLCFSLITLYTYLDFFEVIIILKNGFSPLFPVTKNELHLTESRFVLLEFQQVSYCNECSFEELSTVLFQP